jgi:hypothetical protein
MMLAIAADRPLDGAPPAQRSALTATERLEISGDPALADISAGIDLGKRSPSAPRTLPWLLCVALSACAGSDAPPPIDGPSGSRIEVTSDEPSGAACPAGGTKIVAGVDDNGSNTLEPDEIDDTEFLCRDAVVHGD